MTDPVETVATNATATTGFLANATSTLGLILTSVSSFITNYWPHLTALVLGAGGVAYTYKRVKENKAKEAEAKKQLEEKEQKRLEELKAKELKDKEAKEAEKKEKEKKQKLAEEAQKKKPELLATGPGAKRNPPPQVVTLERQKEAEEGEEEEADEEDVIENEVEQESKLTQRTARQKSPTSGDESEGTKVVLDKAQTPPAGSTQVEDTLFPDTPSYTPAHTAASTSTSSSSVSDTLTPPANDQTNAPASPQRQSARLKAKKGQ